MMAKGKIYNFIIIDSIDNKHFARYTVEKTKKKKGLFAPRVEAVSLDEGTHVLYARGITHQKKSVKFEVEIEDDKYYMLSADENGLYLEERPYEWTLK